MRSYKVIAGGHADRFHRSRMKIRVFAGGFANGKTTGLVADTLKIAVDYPGAAILMARATYPKLNSTLRREFIKWCPESWIKSFDKSRENTCVLKNGTIIDFRYIDQSKDEDGEGTSNLLSANYDFIVVDQIDDVQISHEDFLNLLGRLRGSAEYVGDDPTMPRTGPRQIVMSCNPTLGWPYKHLVKPLYDLRDGRHNPELICEVDDEGRPVLVDGKPIPLVEVFEASTYENAQNLERDYIKLLEATYRGKMRDRYLLGKWVAFDGVVYDEFDDNMHVIPQARMEEYIQNLRQQGVWLSLIEGYDFGLASPSCYLLGLTDPEGNIVIPDGFYQENMGIRQQANEMKRLRMLHHPEAVWSAHDLSLMRMFADPAIFRKTNAGRDMVGPSVAEMFADESIIMSRGNNHIMNGIVKVKQYLAPQHTVLNPFTGTWGSPKLFISDKLTWFREEIASYRWKRNRKDDAIDMPVDAKNHAMDALKYMVSKQATPAQVRVQRPRTLPDRLRRWHEQDVREASSRDHRYRM